MFQANQQIGNYTLIKQIGRGGFGEVWLAERRTALLTTKVAVKLPHDSLVNLETVRQEAILWEQASGHPNILPIIEANIYDEQVVFVSEYAPDGSLADLLNREGQISLEDAVKFTIGITAGLEFLHSRRIIHRDLKPANILLQGETPRLADFGISHALQTTVSSRSKNIKGTFSYMPPEAFDGKRNEQTDIWSIGVILYQMLQGRLPFPQEDSTALLGAIVMHEPQVLPKTVPTKLKALVAKCLAKLPENRYQTARDLRLDLEKELVNISHPGFAATEVLVNSDFETEKDLKVANSTVTDILPRPVPPTQPQQFVTKPTKNSYLKSFMVIALTVGSIAVLAGLVAGLAKLIEYANSNRSKAITELTHIPYRKGDKWGFVDKNKKIVIEPKYDSVEPFQNGRAIVKINYKYGLIDESGKEITSVKYGTFFNFSDELAFVAEGSVYAFGNKSSFNSGFIDKSGNVVIPLKYENGSSFSENLATVKQNGKWGYIDKSGKTFLPFIYDETNFFKDGLAFVSQNGEWNLIDKTGTAKFKIECKRVWAFVDGWALVENKSGSYNFIDKDGKMISTKNFDDARPFSEGLASVRLGGKWGFIDKSGKQVIPFKYGDSGSFKEGLAPVIIDLDWGFIDKTDTTIIPFKYSSARAFENEVAYVEIEDDNQDKEFYITRNGTEYFDNSEIYNKNSNQSNVYKIGNLHQLSNKPLDTNYNVGSDKIFNANRNK